MDERHSYKPQLLHTLKDNDYSARLSFAIDELLRINESFHINGNVNRHNCRYWATENPDCVLQIPLHSPKVVVLAGISQRKIYCSFFFDENVNFNNYLYMLANNSYLSLIRTDQKLSIFMQDSSHHHWINLVSSWLDEKFKQSWMGCGSSNLSWPARSPDFTPCNYFMWGFKKTKVYTRDKLNITDLKQKITEAFTNITKPMLSNVFSSYWYRLKKVVEFKGSHIEQESSNET